MDENKLSQLLEAVREGRADVDEAAGQIRQLVEQAELSYAHLDHYRERRTGVPEVVYCEGKTPEQAVAIMGRLLASEGRVLATRVPAETAVAALDAFPDAHYHPLARVLSVGRRAAPAGLVAEREADRRSYVAIATAGTSDLPVAEEAALTLEFLGDPVKRTYDVGVAGIHRLLSKRDLLSGARVVIAVAGMEGALASVVGGLVRCPVVAVPTSVGYGASFGGVAALLAMLNSCAPGVAVVNIDNGFGAGVLAHKIIAGGCP